MPSSVYLQRKHKKITGLVNAVKATKCMNCGSVYPYGATFRGWCATCIANSAAEGRAAAKPLYATLAEAQAAGATPPPVSARQVSTIKEHALTPKNDREFIPLTMFAGNVSIGQSQAWMNVIEAMKTVDAKTTAEACALSRALPDPMHACGRHAPVQSGSLRQFFSRLNSASAFVIDRATRDYLRGFISDNRITLFTLSPIAEFSRQARRTWRHLIKHCRVCHNRLGPHRSVFCSESCSLSYRRDQQQNAPTRKRMTDRKQPTVWPFLSQAATTEHELLLKIDGAVPKALPHQIREDVCQDLVVAVLSGEVSLEALQGSVAKYVAQVFKLHPTKYGPLSLDQPAPWAKGDDRPLMDLLGGADEVSDWDAISGADGLTGDFDGPILDAFGEVIYSPGRLTTDYKRLISEYGKAPVSELYREPDALTRVSDDAIPIWRPHVEEESAEE